MIDTNRINSQAIELLNETLVSSPAVIYRVDARPPYFMQYLSANVESLLDIDGDILRQESGWDNLIHCEDYDESFAKFEDLLANSDTFEIHRNYRLKTRSGNYIWVADRSKKIFRKEQLVSIVGSVVSVDMQYRQQQMFNALMQAIPGMVYQFKIDANGKFSFPFVSPKIIEIYGVSAEQAYESADAIFDAIHPDDARALLDSIDESRKNLSVWSFEYRVVIDGQTEWVRGQAQPTSLSDGSTLWHGQIMIITRQKEMEQALTQSKIQLKEAQRIAKLGHWVAYPEQGRLEWSDNVFDILKLDRSAFKPSIKKFTSLIHPDDVALEKAATEEAWQTGKYDVAHRVSAPNGKIIWVHQLGEARTSSSGELQLFGTVRDITAEKHNEENLRILAATDALTGVANRRYLNQMMTSAVADFQATGSIFSLIMFDYDFFKSINDTHGHSIGDQVLITGTQLIQQTVRSNDLFARLGGEEFAVILYGANIYAATRVAHKLRKQLSELIITADGKDLKIKVTASFGVVEMSNAYQSPDDLLSAVDKALYQAKNNGRNQVIQVLPT